MRRNQRLVAAIGLLMGLGASLQLTAADADPAFRTEQPSRDGREDRRLTLSDDQMDDVAAGRMLTAAEWRVYNGILSWNLNSCAGEPNCVQFAVMDWTNTITSVLEAR